MLQFLSLFSGIGAFEKALDRLGVHYNLVNYCEIDKYASKSYSAVHGVSESLNLGDITKVDTGKLPKNIDIISYGFPCQDISLAGKQKGILSGDVIELLRAVGFDDSQISDLAKWIGQDERTNDEIKNHLKYEYSLSDHECNLLIINGINETTRSGLFFQALRIIEDTKPKVAIAENVKNLTSKKFTGQFQIVLESLENAGYVNYWAILNSRNFGIPQNRERVFIVSIRKDLDTGAFNFPEPFELKLRLRDLLEAEVDEKYYIDIDAFSKTGIRPTLITTQDGKSHIAVRENNKKGYTEAYEGDAINLEQRNSKTRRGRVGHGVAQTINTTVQQAVVTNFVNGDICKTIRSSGHGSIDRHSWDMVECSNTLRIRRYTPLECWRLMGFDDEDFYKANKVNSDTQLYKQAGNSIVVNVLVYLFKEILEAVDMKKTDETVVVYECDDLINLEKFKEAEPDLYSELLKDYPAETGTYIFRHQTA